MKVAITTSGVGCVSIFFFAITASIGLLFVGVIFLVTSWISKLDDLSKVSNVIGFIILGVLVFGILIVAGCLIVPLLKTWTIRFRTPSVWLNPAGGRLLDLAEFLNGAEPARQIVMLKSLSSHRLGLSPNELFESLVASEQYISASKALDVYWEKRNEIEEILKQERQGAEN